MPHSMSLSFLNQFDGYLNQTALDLAYSYPFRGLEQVGMDVDM